MFTMNPHSCCMKICIITQNVDGLQQQAFGKHSDSAATKFPRALPEVQMASPSAAIKLNHPQLIQAHGQKGLFKCLNTADKCPYASTQSWSGVSLKRPLSDLSQVPRCPGCGRLCPPQVLQFDEDYESHAFYQIEKAGKRRTQDSHANCSYDFMKCNIFYVIVKVIFLFTKNILRITHPIHPHTVGSALVTRSRCHRPSWHLCERVYHRSCHPGSTLKKGFTGALFSISFSQCLCLDFLVSISSILLVPFSSFLHPNFFFPIPFLHFVCSFAQFPPFFSSFSFCSAPACVPACT